MRAAVLKDSVFQVEERDTPVPGSGQVLLKTRLCGICGSDLHLAKHAEEIARMAESMGAPAQDLQKGIILGHEFIGEVAGFGPETEQSLALGARVTSVPFLLEGGLPKPIGSTVDVDGAYAQFMLASEALLLRVPDEVPDEAAALVEPFAIGLHAVNKAGLDPAGAVAIVMGCGPIGLAIVNVLKMRGAPCILASDFSPKRRELAEALGAHEAMDPRTQDPVSVVTTSAEGRPVVIYDCTGARGVLGRLVTEAPAQTRIVVAGIAHGEETINPMVAIAKEIAIQFVVYYTPGEFAETLSAIAEGQLNWQPLVTARVGLEAVGDAFVALEDPERHAKIMIDPWSDAPLRA